MAEIRGVVTFLRSESEDCICCEGRHVFCRYVEVPEYEGRSRAWENASTESWLHDQIAALEDDAEGKTIRITFEVVEKAAEAYFPQSPTDTLVCGQVIEGGRCAMPLGHEHGHGGVALRSQDARSAKAGE